LLVDDNVLTYNMQFQHKKEKEDMMMLNTASYPLFLENKNRAYSTG
jgi:hypothetical protein